jgi:DNA-binding CsgD family transcriptional regulator
MDFSAKYWNIIFNKQKLLEFIAVLLIFIAIGFSFGREGAKWFWNDYPFIAMILVIVGLLSSLLWIKIEKHKTQVIIKEIEKSSKAKSNIINEKVDLLTKRQREIFDLILQGNSNKEIMDKLFIELSTLKTHINHIYRTLEVGNRKEAKAIGKSYVTDEPN